VPVIIRFIGIFVLYNKRHWVPECNQDITPAITEYIVGVGEGVQSTSFIKFAAHHKAFHTIKWSS
jgi:hypothetical protein